MCNVKRGFRRYPSQLETFSILGDINIILCNNRNRVPNGHEELLGDVIDDGDDGRLLVDLVVQHVSSVTNFSVLVELVSQKFIF